MLMLKWIFDFSLKYLKIYAAFSHASILFHVPGICHTCGEKVTGAGQACQAMGNLYHTNCFICCSCGKKKFYNFCSINNCKIKV